MTCLKTMRRIQEQLSSVEESEVVDQEPTSVPAALALKQKRLTFAWLDGEAQNVSLYSAIVTLHIVTWMAILMCNTITFGNWQLYILASCNSFRKI